MRRLFLIVLALILAPLILRLVLPADWPKQLFPPSVQSEAIPIAHLPGGSVQRVNDTLVFELPEKEKGAFDVVEKKVHVGCEVRSVLGEKIVLWHEVQQSPYSNASRFPVPAEMRQAKELIVLVQRRLNHKEWLRHPQVRVPIDPPFSTCPPGRHGALVDYQPPREIKELAEAVTALEHSSVPVFRLHRPQPDDPEGGYIFDLPSKHLPTLAWTVKNWQYWLIDKVSLVLSPDQRTWKEIRLYEKGRNIGVLVRGRESGPWWTEVESAALAREAASGMRAEHPSPFPKGRVSP